MNDTAASSELKGKPVEVMEYMVPAIPRLTAAEAESLLALCKRYRGYVDRNKGSTPKP